MRTFDTGATRNTTDGKPEYTGYLSPLAMRSFGEYMMSHQIQADGNKRAADNWQKGIPLEAYMDSAWRHFFDWWELARKWNDQGGLTKEDENRLIEALNALHFNQQGYQHELLKLIGSTEEAQILEAARELGETIVPENYVPDTRPVAEGEIRDYWLPPTKCSSPTCPVCNPIWFEPDFRMA